MSRNSIRIGICAKWMTGALAFVLASMSYASGTLVGGGTTLTSIGYVGSNAATNLQVWGTATSNPMAPIAANSLFGVYQAQTDNPNVSYCLSGSVAGKDILAGVTLSDVTYNVQNNCTENSAGIVSGFGAALSGVNRSDLTQPNFAGTDSPLSASDYNNYQTGHGSSAFPTEFPAMAGSIAVAFNLTDSFGDTVTSSEVNFADAQLCEIFSGEITNWSDARLASAFTLPSGRTIPSSSINVVYNMEGSGTTFGFSNHLAAVCDEINGTYFETSESFSAMVGNFLPTLPVTWLGVSSDEAVAGGVEGVQNSIGYVETAYALPTLSQIADVNGLSPVADFGTPLTANATTVVYNEVISDTNNINGTPAIEAISSIITGSETAPPLGSECIVLIKPSLYARQGVKGGLIPSTGTYPIVSVSYLLSHAQGIALSDLAYTQGLVNAPYNSSITSSVTTIGPDTGLAFLTVASSAFGFTAPGNCINSGE